jgi:hypothetical protein
VRATWEAPSRTGGSVRYRLVSINGANSGEYVIEQRRHDATGGDSWVEVQRLASGNSVRARTVNITPASLTNMLDRIFNSHRGS